MNIFFHEAWDAFKTLALIIRPELLKIMHEYACHHQGKRMSAYK